MAMVVTAYARSSKYSGSDEREQEGQGRGDGVDEKKA